MPLLKPTVIILKHLTCLKIFTRYSSTKTFCLFVNLFTLYGTNVRLHHHLLHHLHHLPRHLKLLPLMLLTFPCIYPSYHQYLT